LPVQWDLRRGRLALPDVQRDVAISTGLSRIQQYVYVLLPQIFRLTLAPLGTIMVHNFKNTSLCVAIVTPHLIFEMYKFDANTFRATEAIILAVLFYFIFSTFMASAIIILERYLRIDARSVVKSQT
jgi:ABC-type amino acid transport system permease subunit